MNIDEKTDLMTISEVAEILRCSIANVRRMIHRGQLCAYKPGKAYLFSYERHIKPYLESTEKNHQIKPDFEYTV